MVVNSKLQQKKELEDFIKTWSDHGDEVADKVTYWNTLLRIVGVSQDQIDANTFIKYEYKIKLNTDDNRSFHGAIDAYIPSTKVLIEQKSFGVDLFKPENRNNGGETRKVTPFEQAQRYDNHLAKDKKADFIVLSNFSQIVIYDVRHDLSKKPIIIDIADLPKQLYLLDFLIKDEVKELEKEKQVSLDAGELVGKIYNELIKQYKDPSTEHAKKSINKLCVRLVFCLYAEDAGLFGQKSMFHDYLADVEPNRIGLALRDLFKVLDTKINERDPYLDETNPKLAAFPYVNGGMFSDENIEIPPFTPELKDLLLRKASDDFDWSEISPTIFGAVFESTLNPETRRQGGMHYTSIENIHKVIDPLFLDDLKAELADIKTIKQSKTQIKRAREYQRKLSQLTFLDPACGSGNFLTETYLSLRKLENEAIQLETGGQGALDVGQMEDTILVSIQRFFGIEINDFAVSVAKTALWIAENQMLEKTKEIVYANDWNFLPLKTYTHIHEGNALQMDWNKVLENYACHYIMGNPPFIGARLMDKAQKSDINSIFDKVKGKGNLDYVAGWYKKASDYMQGTNIKCAYVSTNSIVQGQQPAILFKNLSEYPKFNIIFAYKSFKWNSEATHKAQVHVVIIGFCFFKNKSKYLYDEKGIAKSVSKINAYLSVGDNVFIENRNKPLINVPLMGIGNKPIDGGAYLFTEKEKDDFIAKEPKSEKYFRKWYGTRELLNRKPRYCLYVGDCTPRELRSMPNVLKLVEFVRDFRLKSKSSVTNKLADIPTRFHVTNIPDTNYLVIPRISSNKRRYIPICYVNKGDLASDDLLVVPDASMWEFGILESNVHMAWMRTVAGRLGMGYRYSAKIVYNNFPWPDVSDEQKREISKTAQGILDSRAKYPDSSLADLYDNLAMPPELRKAHIANDKAVMAVYGMSVKTTSESDAVEKLFEMYQKLTK